MKRMTRTATRPNRRERHDRTTNFAVPHTGEADGGGGPARNTLSQEGPFPKSPCGPFPAPQRTPAVCLFHGSGKDRDVRRIAARETEASSASHCAIHPIRVFSDPTDPKWCYRLSHHDKGFRSDLRVISVVAKRAGRGAGEPGTAGARHGGLCYQSFGFLSSAWRS